MGDLKSHTAHGTLDTCYSRRVTSYVHTVTATPICSWRSKFCGFESLEASKGWNLDSILTHKHPQR